MYSHPPFSDFFLMQVGDGLMLRLVKIWNDPHDFVRVDMNLDKK